MGFANICGIKLNLLFQFKNQCIINKIKLEKHQNKIEDLLDVIVAEGRKDDKEISWEDVKAQLNASDKK